MTVEQDMAHKHAIYVRSLTTREAELAGWLADTVTSKDEPKLKQPTTQAATPASLTFVAKQTTASSTQLHSMHSAKM